MAKVLQYIYKSQPCDGLDLVYGKVNIACLCLGRFKALNKKRQVVVMPNIDACLHENQPLSESLSIIIEKVLFHPRKKKKENLCPNLQNYKLSTQVIDNASTDVAGF